MAEQSIPADVHTPVTPKRREFTGPEADPLNEETPLLGGARYSARFGSSDQSIVPATGGMVPPPGFWPSASHTPPEPVQSKSTRYLTLLTLCLGGLQIAWSVEFSNGSPYLLSLGMSKSLMALVWIAGPLTGSLVQPYVGMMSDSCSLSWGRRKPFMIVGTAVTVVSLLCLSWTKEIVTWILTALDYDPESDFVKNSIVVVAVLGIYVLDIAVNTVQASIRAFIVDGAPHHQQEAANSMAGRMLGLGNIIGFLAGYVELHHYLPWIGSTQFQALCAFASASLVITIIISTSAITEKNPQASGLPAKKSPTLLGFFGKLFVAIRRLPVQIKRVCFVQIFSWIGWFPFLFYTSSYIGDLYIQPFLKENPNLGGEELEKLYEEATRVGTLALFINAVVTLGTNLILPFFIAPTYDKAPVEGSTDAKTSFLDSLRIPGLTLKRAWFLSLLFFAGALFATLFVESVQVATVLIGCIGFTWALTLWAPFAIISAEISQRDALLAKQRELARQWFPFRTPQGLGTYDASAHSDELEEHDDAGVIMGIHNMSMSAPQIIANLSSSLIFHFFQKPRGTPDDRSMSYVFAVGGIFVLIASVFVARIDDSSLEDRMAEENVDEEASRFLSPSGEANTGEGASDSASFTAKDKQWAAKRGVASSQSSVHEHESDDEEEWAPEPVVAECGEASGATLSTVEEPDTEGSVATVVKVTGA